MLSIPTRLFLVIRTFFFVSIQNGYLPLPTVLAIVHNLSQLKSVQYR